MKTLQALARGGEWRELEEALTAITGMPMVARPVRDLVGLAEVAAVTGMPRTTIRSAMTRAQDGPRVLFALRATPVYSAGEVVAWLAGRVINFGGRKPKTETVEPVPKPRKRSTAKKQPVDEHPKLVTPPRPGQVFVP
jgi:hypothetical protein